MPDALLRHTPRLDTNVIHQGLTPRSIRVVGPDTADHLLLHDRWWYVSSCQLSSVSQSCLKFLRVWLMFVWAVVAAAGSIHIDSHVPRIWTEGNHLQFPPWAGRSVICTQRTLRLHLEPRQGLSRARAATNFTTHSRRVAGFPAGWPAGQKTVLKMIWGTAIK